MRIVRIRRNGEVPDYYTEFSEDISKQEEHSQASGICQYGDVFWGIVGRPYKKPYTGSYKLSKIDRPSETFNERDMIELYPVQLQPGDNAYDWCSYVNSLRYQSVQFNEPTNLPLPLHLAMKLKEYFITKKK